MGWLSVVVLECWRENCWIEFGSCWGMKWEQDIVGWIPQNGRQVRVTIVEVFGQTNK
jgi:hypothetical protein